MDVWCEMGVTCSLDCGMDEWVGRLHVVCREKQDVVWG